ncbi:hypothetical protein F5880DRAFT_1492397, partial [Lentinula raphanica]
NSEAEEEGANQDLDSTRKVKCAVVKTSTRQIVFRPLIGLVPPEKLQPGDLVGVNKDSYDVVGRCHLSSTYTEYQIRLTRHSVC